MFTLDGLWIRRGRGRYVCFTWNLLSHLSEAKWRSRGWNDLALLWLCLFPPLMAETRWIPATWEADSRVKLNQSFGKWRSLVWNWIQRHSYLLFSSLLWPKAPDPETKICLEPSLIWGLSCPWALSGTPVHPSLGLCFVLNSLRYPLLHAVQPGSPEHPQMALLISPSGSLLSLSKADPARAVWTEKGVR